jgi:hypothetical protein
VGGDIIVKVPLIDFYFYQYHILTAFNKLKIMSEVVLLLPNTIVEAVFIGQWGNLINIILNTLSFFNL